MRDCSISPVLRWPVWPQPHDALEVTRATADTMQRKTDIINLFKEFRLLHHTVLTSTVFSQEEILLNDESLLSMGCRRHSGFGELGGKQRKSTNGWKD